MLPAVIRHFAPTLLLAVVSLAEAADSAPRSTPSRPGSSPAASAPPAPAPAANAGAPLAMRKFRGIDYVNVADVASRLGLQVSISDRGRKARLTGKNVRADLEHDDRDAAVNGLRVVLGDPVQASGGQVFVSRIDFERCLAPLLKPGWGVVPRAAPRTIVLDPGHGGRDQGTSIHEKTYALDVARRAEKLLEAAGFRVVLTREADHALDLSQRSDIANAKRGDVFVSIHFNAVPNDKATSGVQVYTFAPPTQHSSEWWSTMRQPDPYLEKTEMPVNRHDHWSAILSQALHRRLVSDLDATDRGKKIAHWGMLRGLECPGVLVECGFLTSAVEARKIATPAYRQKIAAAIAAGIRDYAAVLDAVRARPPGPSVAANSK